MKRHTTSPFSRPRLRQRLSPLALAVAATLAAASAAAGEDVRQVAAMRARVLPDGRLSTQLILRTAAVGAAPGAANGKATLPVTSCADDGGPGTLRSVVAAAADGATIDLRRLDCDRIVLGGQAIAVLPMTASLTLLGPGRDALTIDAAGLSGALLHSGVGTLAISGLSIANGHVVDDWGGCISAPGGSVRLNRVRVRGCVAHQASEARGAIQGGAIFAFKDVTLEDSEVLDNTVSSELPGSPVPPGGGGDGIVTYPLGGGAISTLLGDITLQRSRVSGNQVISTTNGGLGQARGGGLYTQSGAITLVDSAIVGNEVRSGFEDLHGYLSFVAGGGLFSDGGPLTISGSTIAKNAALSKVGLVFERGGGIAYLGEGARIRGSTIEGNRTSGDGGGLHHQGPSLKLANSTISGNAASRGAGGLYDVSSTVLDHVTIAFNRGGTVGGALLPRGAEAHSSIVSGNSVDGGAYADLITSNGRAVSGGHNMVGDAGAVLPADTLNVDPLLRPLADNGGPTRTHALDPSSPAIDAGEATAGLRFDQRGAGFRRKSGPASDIGAYEIQNADDLYADGFEDDDSPAL